MAKSVAVLGSANMDLVTRAAHRPEPGETIFGTHFTTGPGGKGLNQAIAAARAGAKVSFIGRLGRDAFGTQLRDAMHAEGIDTTQLIDSDAATGIAQIAVTEDAENTIIVVSGANADAEFTDGGRASIASADYLVLQAERPTSLLIEAMTFARRTGVTTVLTPAPVSADLAPLVPLADILVPNEGEALQLSAEADAEAAAIALSRDAGLVIVTVGARGALVARDGELIARADAVRVEAVDTTAAGDTFVGVLVAWLAAGHDLEEALRAAVTGAALAVTRPGAADSMPNREQILTHVAHE